MATHKELTDALEVLCAEADRRLPPGYELTLTISPGEMSLSVVDPEGEDVDWLGGCVGGGSSWGNAIEACIDHARDKSDEMLP